MTEVVGTTGVVKTCKSPIKSSSPTYQHPLFTDRMPFLSPNQQWQSTEGRQAVTQFKNAHQYIYIYFSVLKCLVYGWHNLGPLIYKANVNRLVLKKRTVTALHLLACLPICWFNCLSVCLLAMSRPFVCLSVTFVYCIQLGEDISNFFLSPVAPSF